MSFTAILFDFDGTLVDSYAAIAASVNHVRAGRALSPLPVETVKRFVGRGPEYLLLHTVPGGDLAADLAKYRAHHPSVMLTETHLLPGAQEVVRSLQHAGKRLGLCSNKPRLFSQRLLEHIGLAAYFSVVIGPEDVARPKPAPDMLLAAIRRLALPTSEVLYVGDMTVDIEAARAAGVAVWVVQSGCDDQPTLAAARPDRILAALAEMKDWLL